MEMQYIFGKYVFHIFIAGHVWVISA